MKAVAQDSSRGYDQPQRPEKKWVCVRGCSKGGGGGGGGGRWERGGGMNKVCCSYCFILSPRGNKVLIFRFQKDSLSWRFSVPSVCTFSIARYFMLASVWFRRLKCLVTYVSVFVLILDSAG